METYLKLLKKNNRRIMIYYGSFLRRFQIPFSKMSEEVSCDVYELLNRGYALTAKVNSYTLKPDYILFNIKRDTDGVQELEFCRDLLEDYFRENFDTEYFEVIEEDVYMNYKEVQDIVDTVLLDSLSNKLMAKFTFDRYNICLVKERDTFCFKEARRLFHGQYMLYED